MKYLFVKLRNIYDYRGKWLTDVKRKDYNGFSGLLFGVNPKDMETREYCSEG
jgi:hypothetical protein